MIEFLNRFMNGFVVVFATIAIMIGGLAGVNSYGLFGFIIGAIVALGLVAWLFGGLITNLAANQRLAAIEKLLTKILDEKQQ